MGISLLHHIATSSKESAPEFAALLLRIPLLDLYAQDAESGWTALHRALYFGNTTIARAIIAKDVEDAVGEAAFGAPRVTSGLLKIKDREGDSPFDLYGASITTRNIRHTPSIPLLASSSDDEDLELSEGARTTGQTPSQFDLRANRCGSELAGIDGDELFVFGSNKNFTLGFGDEDDRQYPERINLKRPYHLLCRMRAEAESGQPSKSQEDSLEDSFSLGPASDIPAHVRQKPTIIKDVKMSKLHSAVLTADPEANLYMCGFGPGGRLGTGDETTRFQFVSIHGGALAGQKIAQIALGQDHTIAISDGGDVYSWGSNKYGQLGFSNQTSGIKEEDPVQLMPRQLFGLLKREEVVGAAASRIHSVVHTKSSLFTYGKNEGQLGINDSDARSLEVQNSPRKVAASLFSSPICAVVAIDRATICLLENHDVWVFATYNHRKVSFPLETLSDRLFKPNIPAKNYLHNNHICKVASGGNTICALSSMGELFTVAVSSPPQPSGSTASTTNPSKIREALSSPQRIWSLKKDHMAVRDVDVGQDGSVIICTESGSVWRRIKRAKIKDTSAAALAEFNRKDYKFSRIPSLTRIVAVRSNTFGAYAAVRKDCDVLQTQLSIDGRNLWNDMYNLLPLRCVCPPEEDSETENPRPRFWTSSQPNDSLATIRHVIMSVPNIEDELERCLKHNSLSDLSTCDIKLGSSTCSIRIPVHEFVLAARSRAMGRAFQIVRHDYFFSIANLLTVEYDADGRIVVLFQDMDIFTVINLVIYIYTDSVADMWNKGAQRFSSMPASRANQVRVELLKISSQLRMSKLEQAVRTMRHPEKSLNQDMEIAFRQDGYFDNGDIEVELDGDSMMVHTAMMCQRCPFFEGLFRGRASNYWLLSRRNMVGEEQQAIKVDLKHADPRAFKCVLRHIYADTEEELFEEVVTANLDEFLDFLLDILALADELMLPRLAQCCQKMLGRFSKRAGFL